MKKSILFIFSLLIVGAAKSQNPVFGFEINPKMSNQIFKKAPSGNSLNSGFGESNKSRFGGNIAATVFFDISPKFSIKSGLNISKYSIDQNDYSIIFGCDIDPSTGYNFYNSWINSDYSMTYLGIPIEGILALSKNDAHPYVSFGGELLINLSSSGDNTLYNCKDHGPNISKWPVEIEANKSLLLLNMSIGYEIPVSEIGKLYFGVTMAGSTGNVMTNRDNKTDILVGTNLFTYGLSIGVRGLAK